MASAIDERGKFTGPSNLITRSLLTTNSKDGSIPKIGLSTDVGAGGSGGLGLNYTHDRTTGYGVLGLKAQVGIGVGGGVNAEVSNIFEIGNKEKRVPNP